MDITNNRLDLHEKAKKYSELLEHPDVLEHILQF